MIEKMMHIGRLYDFYGALLTERQRKSIELHYLQDLSLGEIAAELGVSRQAVNDILRRTEEAMEQYEARLHLLSQDQEQKEVLRQVRGLIVETLGSYPEEERLLQALTAIDAIYK